MGSALVFGNAKTALIFCLRERRRRRRRLLHQNDRTDVPQGWTLDSQVDHISLCVSVCLCVSVSVWVDDCQSDVKLTSSATHVERDSSQVVMI